MKICIFGRKFSYRLKLRPMGYYSPSCTTPLLTLVDQGLSTFGRCLLFLLILDSKLGTNSPPIFGLKSPLSPLCLLSIRRFSSLLYTLCFIPLYLRVLFTVLSLGKVLTYTLNKTSPLCTRYRDRSHWQQCQLLQSVRL